MSRTEEDLEILIDAMVSILRRDGILSPHNLATHTTIDHTIPSITIHFEDSRAITFDLRTQKEIN